MCKELGIEISEESVDQKILDAIDSVYLIIACAEATSNLSNLSSIIYGPRSDKWDDDRL